MAGKHCSNSGKIPKDTEMILSKFWAYFGNPKENSEELKWKIWKLILGKFLWEHWWIKIFLEISMKLWRNYQLIFKKRWRNMRNTSYKFFKYFIANVLKFSLSIFSFFRFVGEKFPLFLTLFRWIRPSVWLHFNGYKLPFVTISGSVIWSEDRPHVPRSNNHFCFRIILHKLVLKSVKTKNLSWSRQRTRLFFWEVPV